MIGKMKVNVECEGEVGIHNVYDYEPTHKRPELDFVFWGVSLGRYGDGMGV